MKELLRFWKKDIINKLIILTLLAICGGSAGFAWLIVNMPQGRSLHDAIAEFLPGTATATFDLNAYLPTVTRTPYTLPTRTTPQPTPTVAEPTFTSTPEPTVIELSPTPEKVASLDCVPNNPAVTGRVVDILDGATIKVFIDGLVFRVGLIGVAVPSDPTNAQIAAWEASALLFGHDVTLIPDTIDKDTTGKLFRYVKLGDVLANYELVRRGLLLTEDTPPNSACSALFAKGQQEAQQALAGQWAPTPTP